MDLIKTVEHIAFEGVVCQETKPFLDQYGGSLIFQSVGKGDYQLTIKLSNQEVKGRILVKGMPSELANKYFLFSLHGLIAKALADLHPL